MAAPKPVLVPPTVGAARPVRVASAAAPTALMPRAKNWRRVSSRTQFSNKGCMEKPPDGTRRESSLYTAETGSAVLLANRLTRRIMKVWFAMAGPTDHGPFQDNELFHASIFEGWPGVRN